MDKGRSSAKKNRKLCWRSSDLRIMRCHPILLRASADPTVQCSRTALFNLRRWGRPHRCPVLYVTSRQPWEGRL